MRASGRNTNKKDPWLNRFTRSLCAAAIASSCLVSLDLSTAFAADSVAQTAAARLQLPDYIGVLEFMGDRTPRGAHVVRSYSYRATGLALDIDVMDYGSAELKAGVDSAVLKRQFAAAKHAAQESAPRGAKLLAENIVQFGTTAPFSAREAVYRLTNSDFEHTSYVWLASVQGRLLEMRFSIQEGFEEDGHVSRSEILAMLGEAIAQPPTPQSYEGLTVAVPRVNVAIVWDPKTPVSEKQLWMTYLLTRAAQIAQQSSDEILPLGERQASFDEEVRARTMAVSTFRHLKITGPRPSSAYFAALDRVEAAGFLREYAWRYLHADTWTTPPGLNLIVFDAWREKNLPNHVGVTYGRIALRLAEVK